LGTPSPCFYPVITKATFNYPIYNHKILLPGFNPKGKTSQAAAVKAKIARINTTPV
jgi:hypothetical protein